ncbi:MAG: acyltransferase [Firmicutes bacterium]|nr:acyltransferase [Bacillota bacterium]
MSEKRAYSGLDSFRLIAAFLVIAIHTSPLLSYSEGADFFLTRVLARLAVPFFFTVTGQFVLSKYFYGEDSDFSRICKYILKILAVYAVSAAIYLPVGIYAGNYTDLDIISVLRMILFDGTFYHIWYFPALIEGIFIVYLLRRFMSVKLCAAFCAVLYVLGLFGDSYYGMAAEIPKAVVAYDFLFGVFSYTRNGLFFTPLFLIMGAYFGKCERDASAQTSGADTGCNDFEDTEMKLRKYTLCFAAAFLLMTAEAFTLRYFAVQRHDSMYIMLPVCVFFLYGILLWAHSGRGRCGIDIGNKPYRENFLRAGRRASTFIYILHPGVIVAVRLAASLTGTRTVLVENSLVHYIAVSVVTAAVSFALVFLSAYIRRGPKQSSECAEDERRG